MSRDGIGRILNMSRGKNYGDWYMSEGIVALVKRFLSCYRRLSDGKTRVTFLAGIALIAISFLVYPAYPLIFLLTPSSGIVKLGMTVTAWLLSWSLFSAGFLLARSQKDMSR